MHLIKIMQKVEKNIITTLYNLHLTLFDVCMKYVLCFVSSKFFNMVSMHISIQWPNSQT